MIDIRQIKTDFLHDIRDHNLTVLKDDRLNRHLKLSNGSSVHQYEITTWPGFLCISGDMGTYTFSKLDDMFQFFGDRFGEDFLSTEYWSEKLQAVDCHNGLREWSPELFEDAVRSSFNDYVDSNPDVDENELWDHIDLDVLIDKDDEFSALGAIERFRFKDFRFSNFYEYHLYDYTYHYIWILWAILWAIQEYNLYKLNEK